MTDSNDPLAAFRGNNAQVEDIGSKIAGHIAPATFRQISQSATADQMAGDPYHYTAFGISGQSRERLRIRKILGPTHAPSYRFLLDIMFNDQQGTEFALIYNFLAVKVRGLNLLPVIEAILEGTCVYIQEYNDKEFTPPSSGSPVITEIEVITREGEEEEKGRNGWTKR